MALTSNNVRSEYDPEGGTLTIHIGRHFDFNLVYEFREAYTGQHDAPKTVVVDLDQTEAIDSSALGMLINMKRNLDLNDDQIRIINAKSDVKKILNIVHFDKIFNIVD
jgi:anti-anti-sigma factor